MITVSATVPAKCPDQLTAIAIDPTTHWPGHADMLLFDICWTKANPNQIQTEALHMSFSIRVLPHTS
jgi:hypothetical protein